jgi:hypothetical protein
VKQLDNCSFLTRDWWDFSACPLHRLFTTRSYEYARQSDARIIAAKRWRKFAPQQSFDGYLELYKASKAPKAPPLVLGDDLYLITPEWPESSFLSVDEELLRLRLEKLYPLSETQLLTWRLAPDPALMLDTEEGFENFIRQLRKNWSLSKRLVVSPNDFLEHHMFRIPWWDSDKNILSAVAAWLKANSPPERKAYVQEGAGAFTRRYRCDLKALAVWRLLRAADGDWARCPPLFSDQAHWLRAKKRAEVLIASTSCLAL